MIMNFNTSLKKATDFFNKITKLLVPLVAASILQMLGENALLALVSVLIIALYLKK